MAKRSFRHWRIVRFVVGRRRLLLSFAAGLLLFAVLPDRLYPATRFIFAWDLMTALYVGATLTMMAQSTVETCHDRAALYDEGDWVILVLVVASAAASFVAIFAELRVAHREARTAGARRRHHGHNRRAVVDVHARGLHAPLRQRLLQARR